MATNMDNEWKLLLESTLDVANSVGNASPPPPTTNNNNSTTTTQIYDTSKLSKLFAGPPKDYRLDKENLCYVISNRFGKRPISDGNLKAQYEVDERNIAGTFSELNFKVKTKVDLTAEGMKTFVTEISEVDYTKRQCLVLFILSHGGEGGRIRGTDMNDVDTDWIIEKLQDIATLNGKPKLVFIQVCRGTKDMEIVKVPENSMQEAGGIVKKAKNADTFVYYSTMKGYMAFASSYFGSFFIFALCEVMKQFYINTMTSPTSRPTYHLGDVVTKVNAFLSTYVREFKRTRGENATEHVQVSEACSSLTRNLYFYRRAAEV